VDRLPPGDAAAAHLAVARRRHGSDLGAVTWASSGDDHFRTANLPGRTRPSAAIYLGQSFGKLESNRLLSLVACRGPPGSHDFRRRSPRRLTLHALSGHPAAAIQAQHPDTALQRVASGERFCLRPERLREMTTLRALWWGLLPLPGAGSCCDGTVLGRPGPAHQRIPPEQRPIP